MKFVTFNIRCDHDQDGANSFRYRKPLILKTMGKERPDIVCFHEVLAHVAAWLKAELGDYSVIGCGRDERLADEQVSIAYRKDGYNLIEMSTFWLSPTPYVPASRYPGQSICPRVCTEALFQELSTGRVFRVLNTHLDHLGPDARRLGLAQVVARLEGRPLFPDAPVILAGDFNAFPGSGELAALEGNPRYTDVTKNIAYTFHDFAPEKCREKIDYIFTKGPLRCRSAVTWQTTENGVYLSDHDPVCAQLEWSAV